MTAHPNALRQIAQRIADYSLHSVHLDDIVEDIETYDLDEAELTEIYTLIRFAKAELLRSAA